MMSKLIDYVNWRGDLTFDVVPFNQVDAALLSQISLLDLDNTLPENESITFEEMFNKYLENGHELSEPIGFLVSNKQNYLFEAMSKAERYKNLKVSNYVRIYNEETICQFEAITFDIGDKVVISYGGTDDTILGWHEDFTLIHTDTITAHYHGLEYLKEISDKFNKDILICGHSKGANIAIVSALRINEEVFDRISFVYCFDGPGICREFFDEHVLEKRMNKIMSYVPYHASIGKLFDHFENYKIVACSANFAFQHDLVNWQVNCNDFVYKTAISNDAIYIDNFIKTTLSEMTTDEKKRFVNASFNLSYSTGAKTLTELSKNKLKLVTNLLKSPKEDREILRKILLRKILRDQKVRRIILSSLRRNR